MLLYGKTCNIKCFACTSKELKKNFNEDVTIDEMKNGRMIVIPVVIFTLIKKSMLRYRIQHLFILISNLSYIDSIPRSASTVSFIF